MIFLRIKVSVRVRLEKESLLPLQHTLRNNFGENMGQRTSDEGVTSFITTPKVTHQRLKLLIHGTTTNHHQRPHTQSRYDKAPHQRFCYVKG